MLKLSAMSCHMPLSFVNLFGNDFDVPYRSHIHLHLGECPRRMLKCSVKGCQSFYALGAEAVHDQLYQETHQVLLKN